MDANRFDALARSFRVTAPRRTALALVGAGLSAVLASAGGKDADARKNKKKCRGNKKKCGKKCIPKANCCKDGDCAENERCTGGACEPCLAQGTACTDDAECCTGICDTYTNRCQQVRVSCNDGESCPGGRCCGDGAGGGDDQCLYRTAKQGACVPDGQPNESCGYILCGNACSDLNDGKYEYCGFEGSAACHKGRCCCPKGIPLENCPNIQGEGNLPRCP
jgi:hypothetical protein